MTTKKATTKATTSTTRRMRFKIYKDESGDWRWTLHAKNGLVIADSAEGYRNRSHAAKMVRSIQADAADATVEA